MKRKGYNFVPVLSISAVLLFTNISPVSSEAFSSTANLMQLVESEQNIVGAIEQVIKEEEERINEVRRYIDEIKAKNLSTEDGYLHYAGHPVNAFNLIKRWYKISSMSDRTKDQTALTSTLSQLNLPTHDDFKGALAAVLRLQKTFALKTKDVANGKILYADGGTPLTTEDCYELGQIALRNKDFDLAVEWLEMVVQHPQGDLPDTDTFIYLTRALEKMGNIHQAAYYAKLALLQDDTDDELAANNERLQQKLLVLERDADVGKYWRKKQTVAQQNYEKLCRGEINALNDPEYAKDLVCKYRLGVLPYITYKEEVLSWRPRIGMFYDVISDAEADMIKKKAYPLLGRGKVGTIDSAKVSQNRVSKVAWLWDEDLEIKHISQRVRDCTGLETQYRNPLSSAEPFQVVNYGMGGQYEPHHDFAASAKDTNYPDYLQNTGERLATFLFYLTDVKHGGATVFPKVNIRVPPVKNAAAFWFNAGLSGEYDLDTEHAGCPVLLGQKWVSNKWIREYGQEFRRKCATTKDAVDKS